MGMKRWIARSAVSGVLAGAAIFPVMGSAQAAPLTCQAMEQRYSDLMGLYYYNNSLGAIWSQSDLATANFYFDLASNYFDTAQTYLNMHNVQQC